MRVAAFAGAGTGPREVIRVVRSHMIGHGRAYASTPTHGDAKAGAVQIDYPAIYHAAASRADRRGLRIHCLATKSAGVPGLMREGRSPPRAG